MSRSASRSSEQALLKRIGLAEELSPSRGRPAVRRSAVVWWLRCLGILAFLVVVSRLPTISSPETQVLKIDFQWLGICMLLVLGQLLLEAVVWQTLLAAQRIPLPYPKTVLNFLASQYLGLVTPGHVGEFLAAGYVSMDTGITFGYALSSVVMKKIINWAMILLFGIWSLPLFTQITFRHGVRNLVLTGIVIAVALSLAITIWVISLRRLAKKWQKLSPWQIDMTEFKYGMHRLVSGELIVPIVLAAAAFSLLFFEFYAVLRSLGIMLPLLTAAQIIAASRIAARVVPLSLAGFGTKDAAVVLLLSHQGVPVPTGVLVTVLLLVCSYLLTLLLSGLCWWIKPLVVSRSPAAR